MSVSEITKIDIYNTFILFWHIKAVVAKNTEPIFILDTRMYD